MKFKLFLSYLFVAQVSIADVNRGDATLMTQQLNTTQITAETQKTAPASTVPEYLTITALPETSAKPLANQPEARVNIEAIPADNVVIKIDAAATTNPDLPDYSETKINIGKPVAEAVNVDTESDLVHTPSSTVDLNTSTATVTNTADTLSAEENPPQSIATDLKTTTETAQTATENSSPERINSAQPLSSDAVNSKQVNSTDGVTAVMSETAATSVVEEDVMTNTVIKEVAIEATDKAPLQLRGTGDLGLIIEREPAAVQIINTTDKSRLQRIAHLGDLSHASVVYSRDTRYAYVFGRDGGLTKIDLLAQKIDKRIIQAGNSIGGAISQDGTLIAVSNYQPAGVNIFSSDTLKLIATIPAVYDGDKRSKVVGLVDAPGQKFVFSLFDAGEIWVADVKNPQQPIIEKFKNVGEQPYDALLSPDGRYYIAGLFGTPGLALLDLWSLEKGVQCILPEYGRHEEKLPVYKMPHLEGWAMAGHFMFIPAVGRHEVLVIDTITWTLLKTIPVFGQPVFVMARPDARHIWVNFAFPNNAQLQVIDVKNLEVIKSFKAGKAILHMEFSPRGEQVWVSARDDNQVIIYDTQTFKEIKRLPAKKPSGIFFTNRAHKMGL